MRRHHVKADSTRRTLGLRWASFGGLLLLILVMGSWGFTQAGIRPVVEHQSPAGHALGDPAEISDRPRLIAQLGHSRIAGVVAVSPDQRLLLTTGGSWSPEAILWDVTTGLEIARLRGQQSNFLSAAFSHDGRFIVTGGDDGTVRVWAVSSVREVMRFGQPNDHALVQFSRVSFSPDDQAVVAGDRRSLYVWDRPTLQLVHELSDVATIALSSDGRFALIRTSRANLEVAADSGPKARYCVWDLAGWRELSTLPVDENVLAAAFSGDGQSIVLATSVARLSPIRLGVWNVQEARKLTNLELRSSSDVRDVDGSDAQFVALSPDGRFVVSASQAAADETSQRLDLWDVASKKKIREFDAPPFLGYAANVFDIAYSPDGRYVFAGRGDSTSEQWDASTGANVRHFKGHVGYVMSLSLTADGTRVVIGNEDQSRYAWDLTAGRPTLLEKGSAKGEPPDYSKSPVVISPDRRIVLRGEGPTARPAGGRYVPRYGEGNRAVLVRAATKRAFATLTGHLGSVLSAAFSQDSRLVATGSYDATVRIWDASNGKEIGPPLVGHLAGVLGIAFMPDRRTLVTGSLDGTIRFWDLSSRREICRALVFLNGDWAVIDPEGRFDSSSSGDAEGLHWVAGLEPIALSQLKERYYEPGLLAKKLGFNPEPLRDVAAFTNPKLYPEVAVAPPDPNNPVLGIRLKNRGGGIGRVVVAINGKEAQSDARGSAPDPDAASLNLNVPLAGHPYLLPGQTNTIEVRAYNAEGYLSSRGVMVDFQAPGEVPAEPPTLWALVAGISDYAGDKLDLRYAAKDAEDMAKALDLGAKRLFGAERVKRFLLTSPNASGARPATKAEFKKVYQEMEQAKPQDILVVYLAGHGVAYQDNYYYLTQDARSAELTDPEVRQQAAVSTDELVRWITKTPALKQVMILDTCQAGALEAKLIDKRDISSDQIRALERLKDRTGFHVLMGSAADAVSYEATRFQQGLLTYALLQGMKGPALRQDEFVDVSRLFQHAADAVPELAGEVGGIQRPRIAAPRGTSFDIGQLDREDRLAVPLAQSKSLLLQPVFLNPAEGFDNLELTPKVRKRLREASYADARGQGTLPQSVYIDAEDLPGAIRPSGAYQVSGRKITATVVLVRDQRKLRQIRVEGSTQDIDALTGAIVAEIDRAVAAAK